MNLQNSFRQHPVAMLVSVSLLALGTSAAQATDYIFSDMGGLSGDYVNNPIYTRAINNSGQVVGFQGSSAVQWNGTTWNTLALPAGYGAAGAYGINDSGQVAGAVTPLAEDGTLVDASRGVRWDNGIPTLLDTYNSYDNASAINNSGQVAGHVWTNGQTLHVATWPAGGTALVELPTLGGDWGYLFNHSQINNSGEIVAVTHTPGGEALHGTAWMIEGGGYGAAHDLGTLGGANSEANSINNFGQIVGDAYNASDIARPVLWNDLNSAPTDLGTLGGASGMAMVINDNGLIAGWSDTADGASHLTLWDHGQIIDLTQFIPAELRDAGWNTLQGGVNNSIISSDYMDMNNAGVIVTSLYGVDSDGNLQGTIPVMLTPTAVPVPAAVWLFGTALAGLVGAATRRKQA